MQERIRQILMSAGFEEGLIDEILTIGRLKKTREGDVIISPGDRNEYIPMVIEGTLKVSRRDENSNEIFLYFLEGGETCAMSISCCLEGTTSSSFVVGSETDAILWMIPLTYLDSWVKKYLSFRRFVFRSYQTKFDELLHTIDSVVFMNMEERLYKYLLDKKQASGSYTINKTHEQIANELHTSRVVVSRLLKKLEKEERIEQHRNRIDVL